MFGRVPRVKQRDETDCGPACLASVAAHYGYRLPVSRVRQHAFTDRHGTNVVGMVDAAARVGFAAKGVKGPFGSVSKVPRPFIAHTITDRGAHHFVVVYGITKRRVIVMDPADGAVHKLAHDEFRNRWSGVLVLLVPSERFRPRDERESVVRRFLSLVRPHRSVLAEALLGAVVYTLLGLSTAVYVQKIVDHVLVDGNVNLLNLMSAVMLVLLVVRVFLGSMKSVLVLRTGQRIDAALVMAYYEHLIRLPQRFFDTMRVGEMIARVNDAMKIRAFVNDVALELMVSMLIVIFSFGMMFVYSWKLAAVVLAIIPGYVVLFAIVNRINRQRQRALMERAADVEAQLVESLGAVSSIKRFCLEAFATAKTEARFVRLLRSIYRSGTNTIFAANASELLSRGFTIVLLWAGAGLVVGRELTPGGLMSFYTLLGYLTGPLSSLINANRHLQDAVIAADRLFEIIDLEREDTTGKLVLTRQMLGDITFDQVSFRFGSRTQVFQDVSVVLPAGKVTAVVGESGSGKSTLLALLQGLYPVASGEIRIGRFNIAHVDRSSLRRRIAVVPQEVHLSSGTILENIAIGDYEPDAERVAEVASRLGILEPIESLPDGLYTYLDERGAGLSGGERQRLAIARALYRRPDILLLDEPTSALDSRAEQHVHDALRDFSANGGTIILVSHRLDTAAHADKIVVLEGGSAAEEGSHETLVARRGAYHRLLHPRAYSGVASRCEPAAASAGARTTDLAMDNVSGTHNSEDDVDKRNKI